MWSSLIVIQRRTSKCLTRVFSIPIFYFTGVNFKFTYTIYLNRWNLKTKGGLWAFPQRNSSDFTPDIGKNLTIFGMSGKETLITNKIGCLNKTNISLSVNIYLITGVLADPQTRIILHLQVLYLISKMITDTKIFSSLTFGTKTPSNWVWLIPQ